MEVEVPVNNAPPPTRWSNLRKLLSTNSTLAAEQFEADAGNFDFLRENMKVLVIGAGGLGCELLKDIAMIGFKNIDVIDMDTIDLSNLNRQFLFRHKDIGRSKAIVAAEFIEKRVAGVKMKAHFCKIQDFDDDFYRSFNVIICGLDSIVARRWINGMLLNLVTRNDDGVVDLVSVIPLIDGGTEGFKGNARVILPGITACIDCNLDLFPKQINYPLCTIAETPRLPEHCIEYIRVILWDKEHPFGDIPIDGDDPQHINWIYEKSLHRAQLYGIEGISYQLTKGVIKNIIPAVASTNAVIAAMCAAEIMKLITFCYNPMNNYTVFNDSQGIYSYMFEAEKKEDCPTCSDKPSTFIVKEKSTLQDFINCLCEDEHYQMKSPSVTALVEGQNKTLYMFNIPFLEKATKPNLDKLLSNLGIVEGHILHVSDVTSPKGVDIRIRFKSDT